LTAFVEGTFSAGEEGLWHQYPVLLKHFTDQCIPPRSRPPPSVSFHLAIVAHPEVQVKGQCEIDSIVGWEQLLDSSDRPFLL